MKHYNNSLNAQAASARKRGDRFFYSTCEKHGKVKRYSALSEAGRCQLCIAEKNKKYRLLCKANEKYKNKPEYKSKNIKLDKRISPALVFGSWQLF